MREPTTTVQMAWDDDLLEIDASTLQGSWTEQQYLRLSGQTNRLIEYADGHIEIVPMPTDDHQAILQWLLRVLETFMMARGGVVRVAPLRLRLPSGRHREPDLLVLREATDARRQNDYWRGADLVAEVISPDDPERDTVVKRADYAAARIPEYWLIDPRVDEVIVLRLVGDAYTEHGRFGRGQVATSALLPDLAIPVASLFDARNS
jgi:Uma2 family endonuclease